MIKFSIITVCLNAGDDLIDTVTSTLNQTYENFEIIVKDGFSSDGSVERLPADPRIRLIRQKDTGIYDAMNQGIQAATGDFCLFINAGDGLYEPSTLKQIAEFINTNEGDFFYGKSYTVSSGVINYGPPEITKFFCYRTTMCHQAMIIRTGAMKERGYDTSYRISADREWMIYAFIKAHMKFVRMPVMVSKYKGDGVSYGNAVVSVVREEAKRMNKVHFSAYERIKYGTMRAITLPGLRGIISRNPKCKKFYYNIRYKFLSR